MGQRVAVATAAEVAAGGLDSDEPLLLAALARSGIDTVVAIWDDPAVDWATFDLVVVRSTWDYVPRRPAFLAWAAAVDSVTEIANPSAILRWNTDKRYLAELAAAGVPVVPTVFVAPGQPFQLPDAEELVVKPTVSAGSKDTGRYRRSEGQAAEGHVRRLHAAGRTAMVQPYIASVDTAGESALIFLGGVFSHAIRKGALLAADAGTVGAVGGLFAEEDTSARQPSPTELQVAGAAFLGLPLDGDALLYARVDLLAGEHGPLLLELELAEPSLFLSEGAGAAERLAAAIEARLATPSEAARYVDGSASIGQSS